MLLHGPLLKLKISAPEGSSLPVPFFFVVRLFLVRFVGVSSMKFSASK